MKAQIYNFSSWISETDPDKLMDFFLDLLKQSNFGIEGKVQKKFKPFGFTALFLLSESHFAIHTFPEENKTYIELSSCIKKPFNEFIKKLLNSNLS